MLLALFLIAQADAPPPQPDTNVVLILADDCTKADLGCYGGQARTPHLDALAAEGMRLDRCYQAAPMCSPTRHCLYTGLYPVKSGAHPNHTFVRPGVGSIALDLRDHGYRTALSGKRHINPPDVFPFEYSAADNNPDMDALAKLMADCATHDTPFLLIACSNEPHMPYTRGDPSEYPPASLTLPPTWVDTPTTRRDYAAYLAEITYFDSQVGQILSLLDEHGHADDTIVVALSEQGSAFPFAKWTCYHAGLGSGMIVRWPGRIEAGSSSDALVEYVDVVPTLHAALGITADRDPAFALDGRSFLPVLLGQTDTHKQSVFGIQTSRGINNGPEHYGIRSIQTGPLRLIRNLTPEATFRNAMIPQRKPGRRVAADDRWFWEEWVEAAATDERAAELVHRFQHRSEWELYDLDADPHEQTNRYGEAAYADRVAEMKAELAAWMQSQGDRGQPTERDALERMRRGRKPKSR